jgi:hypothetical protein
VKAQSFADRVAIGQRDHFLRRVPIVQALDLFVKLHLEQHRLILRNFSLGFQRLFNLRIVFTFRLQAILLLGKLHKLLEVSLWRFRYNALSADFTCDRHLADILFVESVWV